MDYYYLDIYGGAKTILSVAHPWEQSRRLTRTCNEHGRMEPFDTAGFAVERNGVTWTPKDGAAIVYCEACVDEEIRDFDLRDASDREAIAAHLGKTYAWHSQNVEDAFEPDRAEGRELAYCPWCAEEFEAVNPRLETAVCPRHGPLSVEVRER